MRRFPGITAFRVSRLVLGEWLGRGLNLTFAGLFFYLTAANVRAFSEVFISAMIPETPLVALNLMMVVLGVMAALGGFEVIARLAELVGPAVALSVLALAVLIVGELEFTRLQPLFEVGPGPMLQQALTPVGVFGEAAWILLLGMPYLRQPRQAARSLVVGMGLGAAVVSLGAAVLIAGLGPRVVDLLVFPTLTLIRAVRGLEFLARLEWVVVAAWMAAMLVKIAILLYGASAALQETLGLATCRYSALPLALGAVVGASLIFGDVLDILAFFNPGRFLPLNLSLQAGLPAVLLVVAWLRSLPRGPAPGEVAPGEVARG